MALRDLELMWLLNLEVLLLPASHQDDSLLPGVVTALGSTDISGTSAAEVLSADSLTNQFKLFAFWIGWVALLTWAIRADRYYLINGWWMVLMGFWLMAGSINPTKHKGYQKILIIGTVTIAATLLIYGTFEWLQIILGLRDFVWVNRQT